ncbi:HAD-IIIC family phosphatase [Ruminiclostridium cellulolyticum]|uniref:FkbH like protein n=1 Tax=Ruminiclostridium cellulolyticum (strain ATCC 35319 / DSM 5812 / JCM 6584 / H10) TaxID=394503 RepID=B8HZU8_RUMCH|nr:HAD-IIIC family phosphatase [Ruminiclostridium cellulolyticum]ACL75448.1 FkbH like protein [Ruminiclostridium cellulolyticum H10]
MIKCIVWDLDDTVWDGTLKYNYDVKVKDDILSTIKMADQLGIIQTIASRNDYSAAMDKIRELNIDKYFLNPEISDSSKADSIKRISVHFNISPDSIAFVDDNDFELYEVKRFLPEVMVYNIKDIHFLEAQIKSLADTFPSLSNHRELMEKREKRIQAEKAFIGTREEFLKECGMTLIIRTFKENDLNRVFELVHRTNQMNNLQTRLDLDSLKKYGMDKNKAILVCELSDIFGEHGIVGASLFSLNGRKAVLDLFCISCRVEGRGIGTAFLNGAMVSLKKYKSDIRCFECNYEKKENNKSAYLLLKLLGFETRVKTGKKFLLQIASEEVKEMVIEWLKIVYGENK